MMSSSLTTTTMSQGRRSRYDSREHSPPRSRSRDRDRSRSHSPDTTVSLPGDAKPISDSDYFLKSDEFRVWLKDEKHKAWNRGKLPKSIYTGVDAQPASSQTGYKWSFAAKTTKADNDALRAARNEVGAATYNRAADPTAAGSGRLQGPTLPTQSDLTLAKELADEKRASERDLKRKRDRKEGKERLEEMVGPKEVGKEGMLEKKRAKREADKSFREKGDDGFDVDDDTLMGGGDSFKAQLARRDAARRRYEEKKQTVVAGSRERVDAIRQKDKATMDMFMQMAKEKFG
ncbi:hypothetical protein NLI96_g5557 [Meripilus lineatus]|uniref:Uncharacterized protein n=1 Tax=Meripilus lineatus TaxID=2056292 RepID=A0AAD5V4J3_9APHY|nr:hypothetical protein NLI96_g5557 [Physisporinus lineatus]